MKTLTDIYLLKSKYGRYEDNAENRRLHRVGQEYGSKKDGELKNPKSKTTSEESKENKQYTKKELTQKLEKTKADKDKWVAKKGEDYYNKRVAKIEYLLKQVAPTTEKLVEDVAPVDKIKEQPGQTKDKDIQGSEASNKEEEIQVRVKFDDLPNSGKVKFKKYLSNRIKTRIDDSFKNLSKLDDDVVQTLHDNLVKTFNDNFDTMNKSERAGALYKLMKVKEELARRDEKLTHIQNEEEFVRYSFSANKISNLSEMERERIMKSVFGIVVDLDKISDNVYRTIQSSIVLVKAENIVGNKSIMSMFNGVDDNTKAFINQQLVQNGLLPIVDGINFKFYDGQEYNNFQDGDVTAFHEAYELYKEGYDVFTKASYEERNAVMGYIGSKYQAVRSYLTEGIGPKQSENYIREVRSVVDGMSSYIEKSTLAENLVLNRSVQVRMKVNGALSSWLTAQKGGIVTDDSFTSFSMISQPNFGDDFKVVLLAKKGQHIANTHNDAEMEYVTQKQSKFKVVERGFNSIVVELVE